MNAFMSRRPYLLLIITFIIISCSREHNDASFLPDDRFTDYYAHVLILKEEGSILGQTPRDMNVRMDSLREAYHMTKGYVDSTVTSYQNDLRRWKAFYDVVIKRLEVLQREEMNRANPRKKLWPGIIVLFSE